MPCSPGRTIAQPADERSLDASRQDRRDHATTGKPACFTPKEQRAAFVHPAQLPNGKQILLLKTLLSSACERGCYYCPFRAGRDFRRATFKPQEFAELFMKLHQAKAAEGLFISSGIAAGGANTQNRLLDTAEILRKRMGYRGYLHLKIMPGTERGQVERAVSGAEAILSARRTGKLRDLASLRRLGVVVARAAPFILLDGKRPASQLAMF